MDYEAEIKALEDKRSALFALRKPIDAQLDENYNDLKAMKELYGEYRVAQMKEENFQPSHGNWFSDKELELILTGEPGSTTEYRHAERITRDRFSGAFCNHGYVAESGQTVFRIALVKGNGARTALVRDVITYILPHIKWRTVDGYDRKLAVLEKRFHIFSESDSGYRNLVYRQDNTWSIDSRYPGSKYESLDSALAYIEANLWYENPNRDDDCDDDY